MSYEQPEDVGLEADELTPAPGTQFIPDHSKSIIAYNDSPDVGFDASINPYRGCEHGCVYCYARPSHEYLGYSAGLDFETKILVKHDAPALLRRELAGRKWRPQVIAMSGNTDCYQPIERKLKLTRRCLEVLVEFRNPVSLITKNHLVTHDIDLLADLAAVNAASVSLSITTLRPELTRVLEPRTSSPARRLAAIEKLAKASIPVGVMVAPVIPALTDTEMPAIIQAAADAGATHAGYLVMRLPHANRQLFEDWLDRHAPERKAKVLGRVKALRGGRLNDPRFCTRHSGEGVFAGQIEQMFDLARRRAGIDKPRRELSADAFRRPGGSQMELFG